MLDRPTPQAVPPTLAAPPRAARAGMAARVGQWLLLGFAASALMHAGVMAALLFWPVRDPVEEPGEIGSVALVFDDTVSEAGGGAMDAAPPPAPPAPPAAPPPAPVAETEAIAPPPPPAPAPAVAAPPAPPVAPDAPRELAALPPDPGGILPPPPVPDPAAAAPTPPAEAPEPPRDTPPPSQAEPQPSPSQQPDPLPLPPPPPAAQQQAAAVQPAPPPRPPGRPAAGQGPVRLDAGAGNQSESSLGSFALGAVVPPGADSGHRNAPPDYPAEARRRGEEGVVRLSLRVGVDGQVTEAEVDTSSGFPALDRAAVAAARRWRFRPATRAGLPVAATLPTAVHFRLSDARGR